MIYNSLMKYLQRLSSEIGHTSGICYLLHNEIRRKELVKLAYELGNYDRNLIVTSLDDVTKTLIKYEDKIEDKLGKFFICGPLEYPFIKYNVMCSKWEFIRQHRFMYQTNMILYSINNIIVSCLAYEKIEALFSILDKCEKFRRELFELIKKRNPYPRITIRSKICKKLHSNLI